MLMPRCLAPHAPVRQARWQWAAGGGTACRHSATRRGTRRGAQECAAGGGEVVVGIDLGTTNSAVARIQDGVPVCIPNEDGDTLTPSIVGEAAWETMGGSGGAWEAPAAHACTHGRCYRLNAPCAWPHATRCMRDLQRATGRAAAATRITRSPCDARPPARPPQTPTRAAFQEGGGTLVGRAARGQPAATTYYSVKRLIGRQADDPVVQEEARRLAYQVHARGAYTGRIVGAHGWGAWSGRWCLERRAQRPRPPARRVGGRGLGLEGRTREVRRAAPRPLTARSPRRGRR